MKALTRYALLAAVLVTMLISVPGSSTTQPPPSVFMFRVGTMDDVNHYIPGTIVLLDQVGGSQFGVTSDSEGFTPFNPMQTDVPVFVTLGETSFAGGISLGQKVLEPMPSMMPNVDSFDYTRVYHQPRALPVYITTEHSVNAAPYHGRWWFVPFGNAATLGFQAYVAIMLNPNEIDAYSTYYNAPFPVVGSQLALVIRTGSVVDLGTHNLALEIDCRGHGFQSAPGASTYLVSTAAPVATPPYTFAAEVAWWEDSVDKAHIILSGKLERGDNFILLHPGNSNPSVRIQSAPPALSAQIQVGQDCIPEPPAPPSPWTCTPEIPDGDGCAVTLGAVGCGTKTIALNAAKCGGTGDSHSSGNRSHWGGSISVNANVAGGTVQGTGSYSWELTSSTTYNYQAGVGGCGQCKRDFQHFLSCITSDTLRKSDWKPYMLELELVFVEESCAIEYKQQSECGDDVGPSTTTCDRVNCN